MWIAKIQIWLKIFPNFTSSSLYVSFLSRAKTNSTNWPTLTVSGEVFVAQLVEHEGLTVSGEVFVAQLVEHEGLNWVNR